VAVEVRVGIAVLAEMSVGETVPLGAQAARIKIRDTTNKQASSRARLFFIVHPN
jgi:hypothetical protein